LVQDPDLQGDDLVSHGPRREEAGGLVEAPRGTLFHHYRVNKHDQVTMANLIVSTTNNNEPMNRAVQKVAQDHLSGVELTEGLLNRIEVAIRAYDPCLSCATHALGQMPLVSRPSTRMATWSKPKRGEIDGPSTGHRIRQPGSRRRRLGPAAAEELERMAFDGVTVDANYQLTVEDAQSVAEHDVVVFVDAAMTGPNRSYSSRLNRDARQPITVTASSPRHLGSGHGRVCSENRRVSIGNPWVRVRNLRGRTFRRRRRTSAVPCGFWGLT
jgi:hypothetical protein